MVGVQGLGVPLKEPLQECRGFRVEGFLWERSP